MSDIVKALRDERNLSKDAVRRAIGFWQQAADERDALRDMLTYTQMAEQTALEDRDAARAERDALRALLVRARAWIVDGKVDFNDVLADDIDAALNKGGEDE